MDTDLINKYIEKLNNTIGELTKKTLVLEIQLEIAQESLAKKDAELGEKDAELNAKIEEFNDALKATHYEDAEKYQKEVESVRTELTREIEVIKQQRADLQDECNDLRTTLAEVRSRKKKSVSA